MMVLDAQGPTLTSAPELPGRSILSPTQGLLLFLRKLFQTFAPYFSYLKIKIPCSPSSSSMRFTCKNLYLLTMLFIYI